MATIVVLLHTLRARRRPHTVSSLFLWERVQRELAANYRRRRLIKTLLLLAQLLIVSLLTFALAGPSMPQPGSPLQIGIIIDTSASMAIGDNKTRASLARERIQEFLSQGQADRYLLWTTTGDLLHYDGGSKEELIARLAALPPPAGTSTWERLYEQVATAVVDESPLQLIVVTDGAVDAEMIAPLRLAGPHVRLHLIDVGQPTENVAITGFSARPSGRGDGHHQILIQVDNFSPRRMETHLSVVAHAPPDEPRAAEPEDSIRSELVYMSRLDLAPAASERILFEHSFLPGERLVAQIQADDPFSLDNVAFLVANPQDATRVLLVGEESRFLSQGFLSFPQVETARSFDPEAALNRDIHYDLVVFYDATIPDGFQGTALALEGGSRDGGVLAEITWWDRRHPVSRFVDWQLVSAGLVHPLSPGPAETVLLQSNAGPLLTLIEEPNRRIIRLGISLEESDFPFRVAFPVFLQNVLDWVKPEGQATVPPAGIPGSLPQAVVSTWTQEGALTLELPTGEAVELGEYTGATDSALRLLAQPGIYTWRAGNHSGSFALSLLDREESDLSQRLVEPMADRGVFLLDQYADSLDDLVPETVDGGRRDDDYTRVEGVWGWVSLGVLVLLLIEGHLYTSRQVTGSPKPGPLGQADALGNRRQNGRSWLGGRRI